MSKNNIYRRGIAGLLAGIVAIPNLLSAPASAEETEKYQYNLFGRNGIELTADNFCSNGNWHTNKSVSVSCVNRNFNGTLTTEADIVKRVKHVYADQKIYNTYFTDNCELLEEEYSYTDLNININSPLFCYGNINLNGNVSLNSNLGTLMNLNITGEVKNANNSVVYSKYGNITIENNSTANINGLIYAPLGTLTINSPNVNINGIVIADKVVINGNCVNINNNDNIARFVGNISEAYDFSGLEYLPEEWLGDTDEDGLFDIYEKVIDSDPLDADTDDDGLPDGYEVLTLGTNPLEVDTDENGISDPEEDFDSDDLNNLGEYINNTQPFNPDTDEDGFMDGSEVYTYGTDPLNSDTDNDGLLDGEESYDGSIYTNYGVYFDPLNPDTNGNGILDGNEVFGQSKQQKVETYDDAITEVNVEMDTNGNLERNLTIESMYGIDAMSSNVHAIIGEPFNFTSSTSFESATISFKVDQSKLGDTDFDNLIILWYNEEDQRFEEMPTTRDAVNSTVSTTTTHFSQYMVVDSVKWYENWERSLDQLRTMWIGGTSYRKCVHTIFLIDCSASMNNSDKISYSIEIGYNGVTEDNYMSIINDMDSPSDVEYNLKTYGKRSCNRTRIPENVIANKGKTDCAKIITFSDDVEEDSGFSLYSSWLNKFIQKVNSNGTNANLDNAISQAFNNVVTDSVDRYRFVVLTDRNINVTNSVLNHNWNNSELIFVNLGNLTFGAMVDYLANATGGTTYDAISADRLAYESGEMIYTPEQYIGDDSDGDGIPDIVELYGLKPNGEPIGTNPYSKDTDDDTIPDNIELHYAGEKLSSGMNMAQFVTSMHYSSDPTNPDTDGDFDSDDIDPHPTKYLLNDCFIDKISDLEALAYSYNDEWDWLMKFEIDKEYWLSFMFIRSFANGETDESDYVNSANWSVAGGAIDYEFIDYVYNHNQELYNYFEKTDYIYANKLGELVDLKHLAATATVYIYKSDLLDSKYLNYKDYEEYESWYHVIHNLKTLFKNAKILSENAMTAASTELFEYHFDNLGGWAGDLQTLMVDNYIYSDYDTFYDAMYNSIGDKSFKYDDLYADTDAYNIFVILEEDDDSLRNAFFNYYTNGYKKRFTSFTNNWDKDQISDTVYKYTKNDYTPTDYMPIKIDLLSKKIKKHWPLFEKDGIVYNFSIDQSRAARDAFVIFLMERINNE
ncbi:MAG TPA: hypothetical protein P5191_13040 [Ruminococcus sp.]|nr:hypothetical protein [Ruminococcus sp.]